MKYYIKCLKLYASFNGRARRKEYWMFVLFYVLFLIAIILLEYGILKLNLGYNTIIPTNGGGQGILNGLYFLAMILPGIAVSVRRMHDLGKSGWYILIPFYNIILTLVDGEKNANKYGEDPKSEKL
jgi:uncharacterized membrane protein YhaH (DUF805 family)